MSRVRSGALAVLGAPTPPLLRCCTRRHGGMATNTLGSEHRHRVHRRGQRPTGLRVGHPDEPERQGEGFFLAGGAADRRRPAVTRCRTSARRLPRKLRPGSDHQLQSRQQRSARDRPRWTLRTSGATRSVSTDAGWGARPVRGAGRANPKTPTQADSWPLGGGIGAFGSLLAQCAHLDRGQLHVAHGDRVGIRRCVVLTVPCHRSRTCECAGLRYGHRGRGKPCASERLKRDALGVADARAQVE